MLVRQFSVYLNDLGNTEIASNILKNLVENAEFSHTILHQVTAKVPNTQFRLSRNWREMVGRKGEQLIHWKQLKEDEENKIHHLNIVNVSELLTP